MQKTRFRSQLITLLLFLIFAQCSNENKLNESKLKETNETENIRSEKINLTQQVDSLNIIVDNLKNEKENITQDKKLAEAEIYSIIKSSYLDHFIIGTKDLHENSQIFRNLGFSIKNGTEHKNGIKNNFIEFGDNSEIELIEVKEPKDEISENYKTIINDNTSGLQYALRVTEIEKLKNSFERLNFPFTELESNEIYSTLSSKTINTELPIFFIQFNNENKNTIIDHPNKTKGIKSIWFETKDIKKSAKQLVDFGFEPIGNYEIPTFKNKVVEFRNNNIGIILIESDKYEISGVTILVEEISNLKSILDKNKFEITDQSNKNIFLNPTQTKSIWIEFLSN